MNQPVIVHGRYVGRTFIPDEPLPETEGVAELIITPAVPQAGHSIATAIGKAAVQRSAAEILAQVAADRDQWRD